MRMFRFNGFQTGIKSMITGLVVIGLLLLPNLNILAQDANALAKDVNKELRESQNLVFNGKLEEAQKHLDEAAKLIEKIKALDPNFNQLKSLEDKYAKQKKELDKRLGKTEKAETAPPAEKPAGESPAGKLPGGVTHRFEEIDRLLQKGDQVLTGATAGSDDWKVSTLESVLAEANGVIAELQRIYGDQIPPDNPEMKAQQDKIAEFEKKVQTFKGEAAGKKEQAAKAQELQKAQAQEWLAKIKPYITGSGQPDYDEKKYLIAGGTADVMELERRKKIYAEAAAVFAEYQKAEFPGGKTDQLTQAEKDLAYALKTFSDGYKTSVAGFFTKAQEQLDQAAQWLAQQEAKDDGKTQPLLLEKDIVPNITKLINTAAATVPNDDPKVADLRNKLADVEARAGKLRELYKERTLMTPDKFKGEELETIKAQAAEFLKKEYPDATVLRTTVISADWKEEDVEEYTDTTQTAIRHRLTRSVTAQIAGKQGNDVFLYTLDVSKDKRTDGSWGELYGHVMFRDPMLEKNVEK